MSTLTSHNTIYKLYSVSGSWCELYLYEYLYSYEYIAIALSSALAFQFACESLSGGRHTCFTVIGL